MIFAVRRRQASDISTFLPEGVQTDENDSNANGVVGVRGKPSSLSAGRGLDRT
jgi:hypothetical protein